MAENGSEDGVYVFPPIVITLSSNDLVGDAGSNLNDGPLGCKAGIIMSAPPLAALLLKLP